MMDVKLNVIVMTIYCLAGLVSSEPSERKMEVLDKSINIPKIVWTDEEEKSILTEEEHKVAFRDIYLEQMIRRFANVWFASTKASAMGTLARGLGTYPEVLILKDPITIGPPLHYAGRKEGIFDISFEAHNLQIHGLKDIKLKSLDVLRHVGLMDMRVMAQLETTLTLTGKYRLNGTGLSMFPLNGAGDMSVVIKDITITAETYGLYRKYKNKEDELFMRDLNIKMNDKSFDVNMEGLLGGEGSAMFDVAKNVIDVIGEEMLYKHKDLLTGYVRKMWRQTIATVFELQNFI